MQRHNCLNGKIAFAFDVFHIPLGTEIISAAAQCSMTKLTIHKYAGMYRHILNNAELDISSFPFPIGRLYEMIITIWSICKMVF